MERKNRITGRFAPSPSGRMHMGNLWSCLLAWLSARSAGGRMVLRLEDLDPDRCCQKYCDQVMRDLEWLGLDWDNEPVYQSRRTEFYAEAFRELERQGLIYPCFCTRPPPPPTAPTEQRFTMAGAGGWLQTSGIRLQKPAVLRGGSGFRSPASLSRTCSKGSSASIWPKTAETLSSAGPMEFTPTSLLWW